jgi:yeast amino acid transporter
VDELPFRAAFGIWGSYVCAIMNFLCLVAQFYVALWPVGGPNLNPTIFFQDYLAGPFIIFLYAIWKLWSLFKVTTHRPLYVKIEDIDIYTGMREEQLQISGAEADPDYRRQSIVEMKGEQKKEGFVGYAKAFVTSIF